MTEAVIVSHGQPSDPAPAEAELAALRSAVSALLPGWRIKSATLAAEGALAEAVVNLAAPLILPLFMADGWFTGTLLPRRLAEAKCPAPQILAPLGLLPGFNDIALQAAIESVGPDMRATTLLIAAHGSGKSPRPAEIARSVLGHIRTRSAFADYRIGFIEEPPLLADAAQGLSAHSLCLPLFVAAGGHVRDDVPEALSKAGFSGRLLPPVGLHPDIPAFIAGALAQAYNAKTASRS